MRGVPCQEGVLSHGGAHIIHLRDRAQQNRHHDGPTPHTRDFWDALPKPRRVALRRDADLRNRKQCNTAYFEGWNLVAASCHSTRSRSAQFVSHTQQINELTTLTEAHLSCTRV
jgi:hypothetical protein